MAAEHLRRSARRLCPELPVFELPQGDLSVLYTPGHLAVVRGSEVESVRSWLRGGAGGHRARKVAAQLEAAAKATISAWRARLDAPFAPAALTVYLNNACPLACRYCYAAHDRAQGPAGRTVASPVIPPEVVEDAARLVARGCAERGEPLRLTLHGGGEPTASWDALERIVRLTRTVAERHGLRWWGSLATNGVMPEERAVRIAETFDEVGLSCDGPPEIQDRQRPLASGGATSAIVERTARRLAAGSCAFSVRATITPETMERQAEIARYLGETLGARSIRFEPRYRARGAGPPGFGPGDALVFVERFLEAQALAAELGCELTCSGVRLDELHGPHCPVLYDVLQLTPDGRVTGCFFATGAGTTAEDEVALGGPVLPVASLAEGEGSARVDLDHAKIAEHRRRGLTIPEGCVECLNVFHCNRECPERCLIRDPAPSERGFRCGVNRLLAERWVVGAASPLLDAARRPVALRRRRDLSRYLAGAPASIDGDAVRASWAKVAHRFFEGPRALPPPIWARRGFEDLGAEPWRALAETIAGQEEHQPISVYVHVPFCEGRCGFCDCYSLRLVRGSGDDRSGLRQATFLDALLHEMDAWCGIAGLSPRPVTTIHLGGGTPNCLSPEGFARLAAGLGDRLAVSESTEWALESTASLLTQRHVAHLRELGFTRLHVGVQTLEDPLRQRIGRALAGADVAERLNRALELGLTVSADVVFGLPGQTLAGLIATLDRLAELGVHGFSLYGLQESRRNRRFLAEIASEPRDPLGEYVMFLAADGRLGELGFRKNHFVHYALPRDRNLYSTHLSRGEDLLALGPTADGVFGGYHYRNDLYTRYIRSRGIAFQGGLRETGIERATGPAIAALMANRATRTAFEDLGLGELFDAWIAAGMLAPEGDRLVLTANGSWFITEMIEELLSSWVTPK